jgi:hypothetical protein
MAAHLPQMNDGILETRMYHACRALEKKSRCFVDFGPSLPILRPIFNPQHHDDDDDDEIRDIGPCFPFPPRIAIKKAGQGSTTPEGFFLAWCVLQHPVSCRLKKNNINILGDKRAPERVEQKQEHTTYVEAEIIYFDIFDISYSI